MLSGCNIFGYLMNTFSMSATRSNNKKCLVWSLTSQQQQGHAEMGPRFQVSCKRLEAWED